MAFGFGRHFERNFSFGPKHGFGRGRGYDYFYAKRGGGRNPFGRGNPFEGGEGRDNFGRHGGGGGGGRFFRRGDIKFALLSLLAERPMHGYEMMKALETQSGGRYTPSAGTIYPTLQMLEDRGFVIVAESEGKKVYHITDAGRTELDSQKQGGFDFGPFGDYDEFEREGFRRSQDFQNLKGSVKELAFLMLNAARVVMYNPAKLPQFRDILQQTARSLVEMINNPNVPADRPASGDTPTGKESAPPQDL